MEAIAALATITALALFILVASAIGAWLGAVALAIVVAAAVAAILSLAALIVVAVEQLVQRLVRYDARGG